MKPLIVILSLVTALLAGCNQPIEPLVTTLAAAPSAHSQAADFPATHGMLIVGNGTVYLSHLPMFHSPHNYQVILEARFSKSGSDPQVVYVQDRAKTKTKIYTLVPETFVLPDVVTQQRSFKADIFRGHFERGGQPIVTGVTVAITRVIHFRKFDPAAAQPEQLQYLAFGKGNETFLAHLIAAAPDFDQVLAVKPAVPFADAQLARGIPLDVPGHSQAQLLKQGEKAGIRISAGGQSQQMAVETEFYQETGDLE